MMTTRRFAVRGAGDARQLLHNSSRRAKSAATNNAQRRGNGKKRIEAAYEAFTTAFGAIEEAKLATADKVAALNEQIAQAHGQEKETIAGEQRKQALAAAAIRAEVSSVDEVAEQLQISVTEVRHLLKMVRPATDSASSPAPKTAKARLPVPHSAPPRRTENGTIWRGLPAMRPASIRQRRRRRLLSRKLPMVYAMAGARADQRRDPRSRL